MQFYPVRFQPVFREKVWGSRRLGDFLRTPLPSGERYGEAWLLSDRSGKGGPISSAVDGPHEGKTIHEMARKWPEAILGKNVSFDAFGRFPVMLKLLDVRDRISLQVHPPDDYAQKHENDAGRIEAWYILDADPDARVIRGVLPDQEPEDLVTALKEDQPISVLNSVSIESDDVILIPPGTVHSISGNALLLEVYQNSEATYRLYDWGRENRAKNREIQLKKALDVIDFSAMGRTRARPSEMDGPGDRRRSLVRTGKFELQHVEFSRSTEEPLPDERFEVICILEGEGKMKSDDENYSLEYRHGDCFLLPAALQNVSFHSEEETSILKTLPAT